MFLFSQEKDIFLFIPIRYSKLTSNIKSGGGIGRHRPSFKGVVSIYFTENFFFPNTVATRPKPLTNSREIHRNILLLSPV